MDFLHFDFLNKEIGISLYQAEAEKVNKAIKPILNKIIM